MENPIAVRSRSLLKEAFLDLLMERGIADMTIGEVCERAQLTRPTFYNHFRSKSGAASAVIDDALGSFLDGIIAEGPLTTERMIRAYLDFWAQRWELLEALAASELMPLVGKRFEVLLMRLYPQLSFTQKGVGADELRFHNAFMAGGMSAMLELWVESRERPSAEALSAYMEHMVENMQAGMGGTSS